MKTIAGMTEQSSVDVKDNEKGASREVGFTFGNLTIKSLVTEASYKEGKVSIGLSVDVCPISSLAEFDFSGLKEELASNDVKRVFLTKLLTGVEEAVKASISEKKLQQKLESLDQEVESFLLSQNPKKKREADNKERVDNAEDLDDVIDEEDFKE